MQQDAPQAGVEPVGAAAGACGGVEIGVCGLIQEWQRVFEVAGPPKTLCQWKSSKCEC